MNEFDCRDFIFSCLTSTSPPCSVPAVVASRANHPESLHAPRRSPKSPVTKAAKCAIAPSANLFPRHSSTPCLRWLVACA